MNRQSLAIFAVLAAATTAAAAPAATPAPSSTHRSHFRLLGNAMFRVQSLDFDGSSTFDLYSESAQITNSYKEKSAVAVDGGLQFNFSHSIGIVAAFETGSRDGSVSIDARLPNPLYLNRPRTFTTTRSGLSYKETAEHLGLALCGGADKLEYAIFAGPSLYQVKADLVDSVVPQEAYPYDDVTGSVSTTNASKSAVGFHAGGRLDVYFGKTVGLGAQVRYGTAKVKLAASGGTTEVTAGGFEAGGGLRLRF